MKLQKAAHTVYKTPYHIVWVTRYRRKILTKGVAVYLETVLQEVRKFHPDWVMAEIGIGRDHVHVHMIIPPKDAVSKVVETLKSVTSRMLKEKFAHFLRKGYWHGGAIWRPGFFVSTVGINEQIIQQYIRHQGTQDTGQAQLEF